MTDIGRASLDAAITSFLWQRDLADRAVARLSDDELFATLDGEANSVAVIMKHVAGNLRSRWTDFLTTDGEKPDRDRDGEFEVRDADTPARLREAWTAGWDALIAALRALAPDDLARTVTIRGEPHTVALAIARSLAHTAHHVGQIVLLAKHWRAADWQSLSIPRGQSRSYVPGQRTTPRR